MVSPRSIRREELARRGRRTDLVQASGYDAAPDGASGRSGSGHASGRGFHHCATCCAGTVDLTGMHPAADRDASGWLHHDVTRRISAAVLGSAPRFSIVVLTRNEAWALPRLLWSL